MTFIISLIALLTVLGYRALLLRGIVTVSSGEVYLYLLSGEVVIAALYLFNTYWIGMRNMMFANR